MDRRTLNQINEARGLVLKGPIETQCDTNTLKSVCEPWTGPIPSPQVHTDRNDLASNQVSSHTLKQLLFTQH